MQAMQAQVRAATTLDEMWPVLHALAPLRAKCAVEEVVQVAGERVPRRRALGGSDAGSELTLDEKLAIIAGLLPLCCGSGPEEAEALVLRELLDDLRDPARASMVE